MILLHLYFRIYKGEGGDSADLVCRILGFVEDAEQDFVGARLRQAR